MRPRKSTRCSTVDPSSRRSTTSTMSPSSNSWASPTGSDGAEVPHEDLLHFAAAYSEARQAQRQAGVAADRRVEEDVVRVPAGRRVAAAAFERNRLLFHRLHEREVADRRV